ncbi:MAG TPA: hypothetical protein VJU79_07315, partial [Candidatus Dormibacteraeota bacterium]|nr:hypothetical protein [Candidatus Dormibacteraeota bacterium]
MKVSVRWLRDYATLDAPVSALAQALNDSGTEVSQVTDEGEGLIVARVVQLSPVPRTQNLQFADVDIGPLIPLSLAQLGVQTLPVRLLTGARNLQQGDLVPYAPPGSRPPAM